MSSEDWTGDWLAIDRWIRSLYPTDDDLRKLEESFLPREKEDLEDEEEEEEGEEDDLDPDTERAVSSFTQDLEEDPDEDDDPDDEDDDFDDDLDDEEENAELEAARAALYPSKIVLKAGSGRKVEPTGLSIDCERYGEQDVARKARELAAQFLATVSEDVTRMRLRFVPYHEVDRKERYWAEKVSVEIVASRALTIGPEIPQKPIRRSTAPGAAPQVTPSVLSQPDQRKTPTRSMLEGAPRSLPPTEAPPGVGEATFGGADLGDIGESLRRVAAGDPLSALALVVVQIGHAREQMHWAEMRHLLQENRLGSDRLAIALDNVLRTFGDEASAARREASELQIRERAALQAAAEDRRLASERLFEERMRAIERQLTGERQTREEAERRAAAERLQRENDREAREAERRAYEERLREAEAKTARRRSGTSDAQGKFEDKFMDGVGNLVEKAIGSAIGLDDEKAAATTKTAATTTTAAPIKGPIGMAQKLAAAAGVDPEALDPENIAAFIRLLPQAERDKMLVALAKSDRDFAINLSNDFAGKLDEMYAENGPDSAAPPAGEEA